MVLATSALLIVTIGCTDDDAWQGPPPGGGGSGGGAGTIALTSELRGVDDCDQLVDAARPALERTVEMAWSSTSSTTVDDSSRSMESSDSAAGSAAAPASASAQDAASMSAAADGVVGTNNQESGVDEGDLVKTDGRRIVSVVDGVLRVTELDGSPAIDGRLDLTSRGPSELFLRGDEVVVVGTSYSSMNRGVGDGVVFETAESEPVAPDSTAPATTVPETTVPETTVPETTVPETTVPETTAPETTVPEPAPIPVPLPEPVFPIGTTITRVSLSDPAAPTVVETSDVEGSVAATRMVDDRIRIVVRSEPGVVYEVMAAESRREALAAVSSLDADVLVPRMAVDGEVQALGGCDDVLLASMPEPTDTTGIGAAAGSGVAADSSFLAGPQNITVLSVGATLADLAPVTVQGGAEVTYASSDALFVAGGVWDENGSRTDVHRFELTGDGPARYTGSGTAPGLLLNQFSLSEREGALRVVTTVQEQWQEPATMPAPGDGEEPMPDIAIAPPIGGTSGRLTVLDTDGALDEIGHVDDLGPGETVQSVRFLGDRAYVVTFRQTDPLYAIDLSDPRAPRVLGELKIPGFSEYLHPVGDGLLMGVGREVDPDTMMDQGLKISLFDVSDPLAMAEVDRIVLPDAWSPVGADHHAFTWDPQRSQAVVPLDRSCAMTDGGAETSDLARCAPVGSALVVGVADGRLSTRGEWSHPSEFGQIAPLRTVVVGADLWSVSFAGLGRTPADDPTSVELIPA